MSFLEIDRLSFQYPNQAHYAIKDISFQLYKGEFVLLAGETGCGKTTLMKLLVPSIAPHGTVSGEIRTELKPNEIGYVAQSYDGQIVTDRVYSEIAFGLENLGVESSEIRRRVGETARFFGLEEVYDAPVETLSGGQKQLLCLASVVVMRPKLLILDEPCAQLDPVATENFYHFLLKLNRSLGITILMAEHALELSFSDADRAWFLENGQTRLICEPKNAAPILKQQNSRMLHALPAAARIAVELEHHAKETPLTIREARNYLSDRISNVKNLNNDLESMDTHSSPLVHVKNVSFRFEKDGKDILKNATCDIYEGEILSVFGGNGSGKSTFLSVLSGIYRPYQGKLTFLKKRPVIGFLPQNPTCLFLKDTVNEDFLFTCEKYGYSKEKSSLILDSLVNTFGIKNLLSRNIHDLSGGEQQKCALVKVLLGEPQLLLLDEPSKGLDYPTKQELAFYLKSLKSQGMTIVLVTHDAEFSVLCSDRCGFLFHGSFLSFDTPKRFFSSNYFYTTAANQIAKEFFPFCLTCDDVVHFIKNTEAKNET